MRPEEAQDWICECCEHSNPYDAWQCEGCQEYKPRECEWCDELFTPWRDTPKSRLEKWECRACHFREEETEQDRIDAAGDDLYHSMRDDGEI